MQSHLVATLAIYFHERSPASEKSHCEGRNYVDSDNQFPTKMTLFHLLSIWPLTSGKLWHVSTASKLGLIQSCHSQTETIMRTKELAGKGGGGGENVAAHRYSHSLTKQLKPEKPNQVVSYIAACNFFYCFITL